MQPQLLSIFTEMLLFQLIFRPLTLNFLMYPIAAKKDNTFTKPSMTNNTMGVKAKVDSLSNVKHVPGGGDTKVCNETYRKGTGIVSKLENF